MNGWTSGLFGCLLLGAILCGRDSSTYALLIHVIGFLKLKHENMVLSMTTARAKHGSYGSRIPKYKIKAQHDVWDYLHDTMLRLSCTSNDQYIFESEDHTEQVPPFACSTSKMAKSPHLLAVVDEDGFVTLFDTRHSAEVVKVFRAHKNAVFDVAWASGRNQLVTASGDQMAGLWDVAAGKALGIFKGHSCSLKSVCFRPGDSHVFATGARDGNILVWDTRCNNRGGNQVPHHTAVNVIKEAHAEASKLRHTPSRKRSRLSPSLPVRGDNLSSVTVINFQDDMSLFSTGATDSTIKVWDLRQCNKGMKKAPMPKQVYPYAGSSIKNGGFSSLVFNSLRTEFYANCTDNVIYRYSALGSPTWPIATYSGHLNSSFCVKSALSRDDGLLLSGSGDGKAYIWNVKRPQASPITLCEHNDEVTMVTWVEDDFPKIVTGADDASLRIWRLHKYEGLPTHHHAENVLIGHAEKSNIQMKENLPPVAQNIALQTCHSTPPRLGRTASHEHETMKGTSFPPTTPTTPKPPVRRNSSISEWLKNSPKSDTRCKAATQDVENSCPNTNLENKDPPPPKMPKEKLTILGTCVNPDHFNNGSIKVSGLEKIVVSSNSDVFDLQDNRSTSNTRDANSASEGDDSSNLETCKRSSRYLDMPEKKRKSEILEGVSAANDKDSDKNMDLESTLSSRSNRNDHQEVFSNKNPQHRPNPLRSTGNQMNCQSSDDKSADSFCCKTVHLKAAVREMDTDLKESPHPGQKRKRKESAEELPSETESLKSGNQIPNSSDTIAAVFPPGLVKRSRSLDLQRDAGKKRTIARGSLTSHAQHQVCTCSCSGNHRHPPSNSAAGSGAANDDVSTQTTELKDCQDGTSLGRDTPKMSNCNGSTKNICFYFRPHAKEVRRSYSDSSRIKSDSSPTATTCKSGDSK
ncbi:denticleless protein homolog [Acanthaster planci]|uniref:Denticleless protein homolog n=1 Tax=Acanthaster planci TaxID=133434 RepID=A0A8B7ZDS8_ACAPL|nr:denticleless protein homolog [Acanthaster planci]